MAIADMPKLHFPRVVCVCSVRTQARKSNFKKRVATCTYRLTAHRCTELKKKLAIAHIFPLAFAPVARSLKPRSHLFGGRLAGQTAQNHCFLALNNKQIPKSQYSSTGWKAHVGQVPVAAPCSDSQLCHCHRSNTWSCIQYMRTHACGLL